eukprot:scaffold146937_cov44-Prasinocladus_malaysianus.AAC.2
MPAWLCGHQQSDKHNDTSGTKRAKLIPSGVFPPQIKYPASQGQIPPGLTGRLFSGIFGATTSLTETLVVKRKIMGPSWVSLKNARKVESNQQVSWCAAELEVSGYKSVIAGGDVANRPVPPLVVASLHVQTHINPGSHANEVVAASVVSLSNVKVTSTPVHFTLLDFPLTH